MRCIVTAGSTYEPLDNIRRLTNFSTGRLGSELAGFLAGRGHEVTLLLGQQATFHGERQTHRVEPFTTSQHLRGRLQNLSSQPVNAVFHAAAVGDFAFGKIWSRSPGGGLTEVPVCGKISTRLGDLLAELVPTPKIIADLRSLFAGAIIVGWKYQVEGDAAAVFKLAERQLAECRSDACVVNGPAYGRGFGLVRPGGNRIHLADRVKLFEALEALAREARQ